MSILLAALLLSADPSIAQQQPQAAAPAPTEKVAEKQICRLDTSDSSSRLRKRVCLTQTEWDRKAHGEDENDLKNIGAR